MFEFELINGRVWILNVVISTTQKYVYLFQCFRSNQ